MAEIPVEKKSSMTWLWILLALILLALLIWWATAEDDEVEVLEPVAATAPLGVTDPLPEPIATTAGVTIGNILGDPSAYVGREDFQAEVVVAEVPTDRGFWIEDEGQRLFALIDDGPQEVPLDINTGQELRITRGVLRDGTSMGSMRGDPIDADTQAIIDEQDVFVVIAEENIEILSRP